MFIVPFDETAGRKTKDWHDIMILDKSCFYCIARHELTWLPPDGKVPDLERVTVQSKK
jgi:hypothetical protein